MLKVFEARITISLIDILALWYFITLDQLKRRPLEHLMRF